MHYGFPVDELPKEFQAEVARLKLASDGLWKTHAYCPEDALKQTQEIIRIISGESFTGEPKKLGSVARKGPMRFKRK